MDNICYLYLIPKEIKDYIISLTENKIFDLCLINKDFDNNCKVIRIINNIKYLNITDIKLKQLMNLIDLNLFKNKIISNQNLKINSDFIIITIIYFIIKNFKPNSKEFYI